MKKLFIHQPLFRVFSPVFSGVIVYLLVLLINNNVKQIQEEFLGEDLYVFIGLSYLIQESVRLLLWILRKNKLAPNARIEILTQLLSSVILCIVLVSVAMTIYYEYVIGYGVNYEELIVFNSIFVIISLIYFLLFISHQYLYKINSEKLRYEELIRQNIEDEFLQFKRDINPHLLFESLESLLVLIEKDQDDSEKFIDHLAVIYRYILSKKEKQLVSIHEELIISKELIQLLRELPYKNVEVENQLQSQFLVVPGTLMSILELISRTSILSADMMKVSIQENQDFVSFTYKHNDKIVDGLHKSSLQTLQEVYSIYSDKELSLEERDEERTILIPKLQLA